MRSKEMAHDYRYFPDPDLLPLRVDPEMVERMRKELPELPAQKKKRFVDELEIPPYDAGVLTSDKALAAYFEESVSLFPKPKAVSNWIMTELMRELKGQETGISSCPVTPKQLADLLKSVDDGTISGKIAKSVFEEMYATGKDPAKIIEEKGLVQISDTGELSDMVRKVFEDNPKEVERLLGGQKKLRGFFVGQVMKATKGKANPQLVNQIIDEEIKKLSGD
jgi:aspartyl-tRNA(Asn)/glutamyl-tRNA(Gln) amidotransferase subunit B